MDLIFVTTLSLSLVPLVLLTSGAARIILGLAFVLFFPGYALLAALFPRKDALSGIERVGLSFGLSVAVSPLMGLVLNYTPWGIRLIPILVSLLLFILIMCAIAWYRRNRLLPEERFRVRFRLASPFALPPQRSLLWRAIDFGLTVILIASVVAAIGTLVYVITTPKVGERFTEFYILGTEGKAGGYPQELSVGEEGKVILGIVNREHLPAVYHVEVVIDGERVKEISPITLSHEEKWEQEVTFTPMRPGENEKVEFMLYKGSGKEPYRSLYLWIDVKEAGAP